MCRFSFFLLNSYYSCFWGGTFYCFVTISSVLPSLAPKSGQGYVIDPKFMLEPNDMEFEVGPEFLLNNNQDEQASSEQGECTEEDVKKPLEEAKVSNPKEHVIDEDSAHHDTSSDDDCCVIIEDTENEKDPKIQEVIISKEQGHQKAPGTVPSRPTTRLRAVRPEAVVEPIVRRDVRVHDAEVYLKVFQNAFLHL